MMNSYLEIEVIPLEQKISIHVIKDLDIDLEKIFDLIADVEIYPVVIPENYVSVKIINQTKNFILSEEQVIEKRIQSTLTVNHTIIPYQYHSIKVIEGLAKESQINLNFTSIENKTRVIVSGEIYLRGSLSVVSFIAEDGINKKIEYVLSSFEKYANNQQD